MKHHKLAITIFISLIFLSCEESLRIPEISEGVNLRVQFTEGKSYFDFSDLRNAEIEYSVFTENSNIESVEIGLKVILNEKTISERVVFETFTFMDFIEGSITKSIKGKEIAELIGYSDVNDFVGKELLNFDVIVTLDDGRVFPDLIVNSPGSEVVNTNVSPNIHQANTTSFTQSFSTFVGCPTAIIAGTYIANATNPSLPCSYDIYDGGNGLIMDQEVTITQTGLNVWRISDVTREFFSIFSNQNVDYANQPVEFYEVCNELSFFDNKESNLSVNAIGFYDPTTYQLNLEWTYSNGDYYTKCENIYVLKE